MTSLYDQATYNDSIYDESYIYIENEKIPQNLKITNNEQKLILTWNKPKDETMLLGYCIYRAETYEQDFKKIHTIIDPNILTYMDNNVSNNIQYYRVSAIYEDIQEYSDVYTPRNLNCYFTSGTNKLEWEQPQSGVSYYEIYRSSSYDGIMSKVGQTSNNYYYDSGLNNKIMYYYKIKSIY